MPATSPISRQSFGRTFGVAATVLGALGAMQLGMVTWAFATKKPGTPGGPLLQIDVAKIVAEAPPPEEPDEPLPASDPLASVDPVEVTPTGLRPVPIRITPDGRPPVAEPIAPGPPTATPLTAPRPTPVPPSAFTPKVDPRYAGLVEQGKLLRNNGDTQGALAKFREASSIDPGNPAAIAEQAFTFEKMSLHDKAAEQWRRIIAMGESAGALYSAARSKLDAAVARTVRETSGDSTPIAEGRVLALGGPSVAEDQDPASARKLTLRLPIQCRNGEAIAVRDMTVLVHFYDKLNGRDVVRTTADVKTRWTDPPANWRDGDTETLEVLYDLPKNGGGEPREYYGYVARVYYRGALQDTRAEPAELNQKFPPGSAPSEQ